MTTKTRYGLLGAGFVVFLVVAPLLVLYVQGKLVHFGTGASELTGIISAKTTPSGAAIFIADKQVAETPGAVRFLASGDYPVSIQKKGYKLWEKHLQVLAGKVTYANANPTNLLLLKDSHPQTITNLKTTSIPLGNTIVYATAKNGLLLARGPNYSESTSFSLPSTATELVPDADGRHLLVRGNTFMGLLDSKTGKIIDYTKTFSNCYDISLDQGQIWAINSKSELIAKLTPTTDGLLVMAKNALSYKLHGKEIYYIATQAGTVELHHANINDNSLLQDQILLTNVPTGTKNQIFIDNTKALFVLTDGNLWRINSVAEKIASGVTKANTESGTLAYTLPGELWWYDSSSNKGRLVSRSSTPFTDFYINPELQYAFFSEGTELLALELDDRFSQNRYILDTSKKDSSFSNLHFIEKNTLLYTSEDGLRTITLY